MITKVSESKIFSRNVVKQCDLTRERTDDLAGNYNVWTSIIQILAYTEPTGTDPLQSHELTEGSQSYARSSWEDE